MDERLEKALEFANYRTTLSNQKRNIRSRMHVLQSVQYKSGSFVADEKTISFVDSLLRSDKNNAIIIDTKENPIEIEDLQDFKDNLISAYTEASNEYKIQMDKIKKARNIKKIMDW
jgi:tRNA splicing endonuclease